MHLPELLLPVGNYQMLLAAIHNGADAIYVGMPGFNARGRAHDHAWSELVEIVEICHLYAVKVHLAFNILIFEEELAKAIECLDLAVSIGVDAFIVQDIGLISLMRIRYPAITIHGSTQMSITNHEAIELLDDLNIKRFVLGRENSLAEMKLIKDKTDRELEVFVHGALCVAYSGQCFTSEAIGGRSANRGQCAQSCRFDYELFVDGKKEKLVEQKYLLSPQDLCGVNEVSALMDIGVSSFKIEGRLKSPEYVATAAKTYKKAINLESQSSLKDNLEQDISDLAVSYSRGFYSGWLHGVAHQELVPAKYNSNRGQYLGKSQIKNAKEIFIETKIDLKAGDGLLFTYSEHGANCEIGEKIYQLDKLDHLYKISMGPKLNPKLLLNKDVDIYLTRSEDLLKRVKKSVTDKNLLKRIPIELSVSGKEGESLKFSACVNEFKVTVESESVLEKATGSALDFNDLSKKLTSLAHTPYICHQVKFELNDDVFIHNRELKKLKQELVTLLNETRLARKVLPPQPISQDKILSEKSIAPAKINFLFRKIEQIDDLLAVLSKWDHFKEFINYVILDFEFGKDYFAGIKQLKQHHLSCAIATNRILKPGEYHHFKTIERCEPSAILIRNLGALNYFTKNEDRKFELIGDFSLNCSNSHSFNYLLNKGLHSQTASYDMNIKQLSSLINHIDSSKLEITVHQYMPEFHMEHCVFAAFLSKGNSFKDCGKPCEKHQVHLKDMYGNRHEIKADQECRNTMFRSEAQSSLKFIQDWTHKGVRLFRFECLHEQGLNLQDKLETYFRLFSHELSATDALSKLGELEKYGLDSGKLSNTHAYQDRKKK